MLKSILGTTPGDREEERLYTAGMTPAIQMGSDESYFIVSLN